MRVAAVTGWSGSGKTTLLVELIAHLAARGERVAAIKHTHHPISEEDRGDTARLRAAGAETVILAGETEAVIFSGEMTSRRSYGSPAEILGMLDADVVLIEGFKNESGWPRIDLDADSHRTPDDVLSLLDRIWSR